MTSDTETASRAAPAARPLLPYLAACVIGLLLALGFGYGAWITAGEHRHMVLVGKVADGTITGHKEVRHTGRRGTYLSTTYHPTFRYRIGNGREVEGTVPQALDPGEIEIGRVVRVIYDPAEPTAVHLASAIEAGPGATPWSLGAAALAAGIASAAGASRLWRRARR